MPAESIKSPTSAASPASDVDPASKARLPPRPNRSNFDLEPNPFEQSFARPSNDSSVRTQQNSPTSIVEANDARPQSRPGSADKTSTTNTPPDSHKTVLPPLAAIASPSDAHYSWAFSSSSFSNSLRSGPLSPAMLTGPQQQTEQQPLAAFDPAAFRTGLTPRMGLTPGTGLTPLLGGPVSFPPASPNTAAFLSSVMNTSGTPSLSGVAGTITPNTLSAITGVLSNQPHAHTQSPLSMSTVTSGYPPRSDTGAVNGNSSANAATAGANGTYVSSANSATQTATNGLFLLSQAHQELTKREEEAAAALSGSVNGANGVAKRGTKRKSYEVESPVVGAPALVGQQVSANGKRTRSQTMSSNGRRASTVSLDNEEEEEEDDDSTKVGSSTTSNQSQGKKGGQQKKPETEEEKRRNFLERNRQAALKCRQRKKAWLAQLQAKVEFLQNENETLKQALVSSREEITRLSGLVGSGGGNAQQSVNGNGMVNGHGHGHGGHHQQVPPSMQAGLGNVNVSLASAAKNVPAMVGGGGRFGY
ncbi:hypothetical protein BDY19DRAFT_490486 [Irpex rosettiformis]|uniref:Uncharacterized protein n=1 Tax=Irpex rosettiformis TaxID=378272 RepID=A0ACB8UFS7_9APHY|nr:hypothetical protein BDY19DRAFT_490486 [Irpex rosettiformis]